VIIYISSAYILALFPKKSPLSLDKKTKTIYILYDNMHSDIIINIEESKYNWQKILPRLIQNRTKGYIAFGWGDKETYLNTPTWSDLKTSTALKALFLNTPSLMHVVYYRRVDRFRYIKPIKVSTAQRDEIERRVLKSFGKKIVFKKRVKGYSNIFYNSPYRYNLIDTCNTWTGNILRESNVTMSYWTPFSFNVINALPPT
jgi:uncharacterized protein (TIGR02117 family)